VFRGRFHANKPIGVSFPTMTLFLVPPLI
jgi:hypothetical protein